MKNSILTKFFIGYFSFAVLGFLLITYCSSSLIYNHLLQEDAGKLKEYSAIVARNITEKTEASLNDIQNPDDFFSDFNEVLDCNILIMDNHNKVIYMTDKTESLNNGSKNIIIRQFNPDDYQGKKYRIDKFYDMYKTNTLSVVHRIQKNNAAYGYVVAHMPASLIKKNSDDVTFIFYVTYIIILILSLLIFFNFMWFIYLPLKQIRLAAMEYAKGNFLYDGLKVNNDEMSPIP